MPYIKQYRRNDLGVSVHDIPESPGELNYVFTEIINFYLSDKTLDYQAINDIVGALEGCKLEFYSRIASVYEHKKLNENGDVYDISNT